MKKLLIILMLLFCVKTFSQERIVHNIEIKGLKKTKDSFIKKLLSTKKDKVLDSIFLNEDLNSIKRLPSVSHAYYQVVYSHKNFYNVVINIEENFTIIPDVSFWTTTNNQFAYKLGVYEYNFLGRNIAVGGFYQNNGYNTYALNLRAPNLFSKKLGLALSHQNWKSEEPVFLENGSANFLYNNVSTELLGLYQVNFNHKLTFGFNVFNEKYEYLSGVIDDSISRNLDLDKVLYKFLYDFENIDYYFHYLNGFKSVFYFQYVTSTDVQEKFLIAWNDFFYFKRIKEKGNWANRLRFGFASNSDSPFAPFALDNNVNLRGVGIIVDRGTASIVYNTEYRYTFYDKKWLTIQGNAFIDAGTWRTPGGTLNDFWKKENAELFTGVGLRFINKKIYNAVFRIDYGRSLKDERNGIVFGIGQYF